MGRGVLPAASALAKIWSGTKGELVPPPQPSPPLSSNRLLPHHSGALAGLLLVGDSKTSMRLGEHDGSIGDDTHLGIEPPLARPLLACEHRAVNLPPPCTVRLKDERNGWNSRNLCPHASQLPPGDVFSRVCV